MTARSHWLVLLKQQPLPECLPVWPQHPRWVKVAAIPRIISDPGCPQGSGVGPWERGFSCLTLILTHSFLKALAVFKENFCCFQNILFRSVTVLVTEIPFGWFARVFYYYCFQQFPRNFLTVLQSQVSVLPLLFPVLFFNQVSPVIRSFLIDSPSLSHSSGCSGHISLQVPLPWPARHCQTCFNASVLLRTTLVHTDRSVF